MFCLVPHIISSHSPHFEWLDLPFFISPHNFFSKIIFILKKPKPVIVTAANNGYYLPLQSTIQQIHTYLPEYEIIVYDLGLDENFYNMVLYKNILLLIR